MQPPKEDQKKKTPPPPKKTRNNENNLGPLTNDLNLASYFLESQLGPVSTDFLVVGSLVNACGLVETRHPLTQRGVMGKGRLFAVVIIEP